MSIGRIVTFAALAVLLFPGLAGAQNRDVEGFYGGAAFLGGIPVGDFGDELDQMFGLGVHLVYRSGVDGSVGVRFGADWLLHGSEDGDVTLISPFGGFEVVELTTTHSAFFLGIGPEFSIGFQGARPYLGGSLGLAYFVTNAVAEWDDDDHVSFTTRIEYEDVALAYAGYAGVLIPITRGDWAVSADFGVRYQGSGEISFVDEDDLRVNLGTIVLDPVDENTSMWILRAGISVALGGDD